MGQRILQVIVYFEWVFYDEYEQFLQKLACCVICLFWFVNVGGAVTQYITSRVRCCTCVTVSVSPVCSVESKKSDQLWVCNCWYLIFHGQVSCLWNQATAQLQCPHCRISVWTSSCLIRPMFEHLVEKEFWPKKKSKPSYESWIRSFYQG